MEKKSVHILLVEDDSVNQLVATLILRQQGMKVTVAGGGAEALALICHKDFQLVLMDIQMPLVDGYETTARIRAMNDPYFKTVPIIAFTASTIADVQELAIKKGMTDLISKPLDLDEFRQKMEKYVPSRLRSLSIDFDSFTDGDPVFKRELISHLIDNVKELQSVLTRDASVDFFRVLHKVKAAVTMLNDREFSETLEEIKEMITSSHPFEFLQRKVKTFSQLCDQMIASLTAESHAGWSVTSRSTHS
ncbi:MAG TPA: response regulator [Cyclobacteriaceae bacterium]|nr:response regulator [Cyclobacteriaceae bacterium]